MRKRGFVSELRRKLWWFFVSFISWKYQHLYKMDIGEGVVISHKAKLDTSINPRGIHIGGGTFVLRDAIVLSHDDCRNLLCDTWIGEDCILGIRSIVLPGIRIGDSSIVAAGSVVTKDVPPHSVVAGNPAKIIKSNVLLKNGKIVFPGEKVGKI